LIEKKEATDVAEPIELPAAIRDELIKHAHAAATIWGAATPDHRLGVLLAAYMLKLTRLPLLHKDRDLRPMARYPGLIEVPSKG
jgi:hypothetical protein